MIKDYTAEDLQNAFDKGREVGRKEHTWVGLTKEERQECLVGADGSLVGFALGIEAKLKEKNT